MNYLKKIFKKNKVVQKQKKVDSENETKVETYNTAIIGAGYTGLTLAKQLLKHNGSVLLIDEKSAGIKTSLDIKIFTRLIKEFANQKMGSDEIIRKVHEEMVKEKKKLNKDFDNDFLKSSSIQFEIGNVKLINENLLEVNGKNYQFKSLVFATGSTFKNLKYPGINTNMYLKANEIFKMGKFYPKVAIYGTNWMALEIGQALSKIGTKVYFIDKNVNPFNDFDDAIESTLKKEFTNENIIWYLESEIIDHQLVGDENIRINLKKGDQSEFIEVNKIISAEEIVSNAKEFDYPYEISLNSQNSYIIDARFKMKNNPNFYAIGDCNGIHLFPNQGAYQATHLANNFLKGRKKMDINNLVFTIDVEPQISFVGMNKKDIEREKIPYHEFIYDFKNEFAANFKNQKGFLKVFTNYDHQILGALLIGEKTKELITVFSIMRSKKIQFQELNTFNFPFFSKAEALRDASIEYYSEFVLNERSKKSLEDRIQ